jgi:putative glycosyltransferase (TIGR04372 family)
MLSKLLNVLNRIKNFPFYFISPLVYAIGTASEAILLTSYKIKGTKKKVIILSPCFFQKILKYNVCNKSLFSDIIINKSKVNNNFIIKFFLNFFFEIEFFIIRLLILILDEFNIKTPEKFRFPCIGINKISTYEDVNNDNFYKLPFMKIKPFLGSRTFIDLDYNKKKKCKEILKEITFNKKFVCLHVRDSFYKNNNIKNYRNSNINNYIQAIEYLIKKNYFIFRLGNSPVNKINFANKFFLDYPYSPIKSDLMDLFLIKECDFYIGNQSGTYDTANMFNKPKLITNMVEAFTSYPNRINDRGIFKKILDKKKGKIIKINEFISMPFKYNDPEQSVTNLDFIENNSVEILQATIEFLNLIENNKGTQFSTLQKKFNIFHKTAFARHYNIKDISLIKNIEGLKITRMMRSFKGTMCESYLKDSFI